ncbi:Hypothetical predicted protein [Paramuricea clavata]|uniref:Uncharacterized protein n=1 Tax=Paramuricea clavata TaxID=317549 RepID=A0A6S7GN94_PARCT|nr:Hypothetical predicted protein [Paramuricea clavata]
MDLESRVGNDGALQRQLEYFQDMINKTMELRDETDDTEEFINLEERIVALREARDRTVIQKKLEEGRQAQVEDISRFRKFVKWLGEEKVGLTGVAVSTAGLITALLIHARGAIVGTAKATSKVEKALANIAKKGAPILVPVLNEIATALDHRAQNKVKFQKKLAEKSWSEVTSLETVEEATKVLEDTIHNMIDQCFPKKTVTLSTRDPPWMSPLLKYLIRKR